MHHLQLPVHPPVQLYNLLWWMPSKQRQISRLWSFSLELLALWAHFARPVRNLPNASQSSQTAAAVTKANRAQTKTQLWVQPQWFRASSDYSFSGDCPEGAYAEFRESHSGFIKFEMLKFLPDLRCGCTSCKLLGWMTQSNGFCTSDFKIGCSSIDSIHCQSAVQTAPPVFSIGRK